MKRIIGFIALIALFAATGCLKDKDYDSGRFGIDGSDQNVVKGLSFGPVTTIAITGSASPINDTISTRVVYNGPGVAPEDIPFTIVIDTTAVAGTGFTVLTAANATVVGQGVIKKGTSSTRVVINLLKSDELDPNKTYGLGLRITGVPAGYVIAQNLGKAVLKISIKNRIDGRYRYQTSANTSLVPNQDTEVELVTNGPNTVDLKKGGASLLATYSNPVSYTVDKITNQVFVTCVSLGVQTPQDPRSMFNPATHNMVVFWKQGNGARTFEETFTYLGPR